MNEGKRRADRREWMREKGGRIEGQWMREKGERKEGDG